MKPEHKIIIDLLTEFLERPNVEYLRFGQVLFNLGINEFVDQTNPEKENFHLRDIHNDSDYQIIKRIKNNLK